MSSVMAKASAYFSNSASSRINDRSCGISAWIAFRIFTLVIPSEVEGSACVTFVVRRRVSRDLRSRRAVGGIAVKIAGIINEDFDHGKDYRHPERSRGSPP